MKLGLILPPRVSLALESVPPMAPLQDAVPTVPPCRPSLELAEAEARALFELLQMGLAS